MLSLLWHKSTMMRGCDLQINFLLVDIDTLKELLKTQTHVELFLWQMIQSSVLESQAFLRF